MKKKYIFVLGFILFLLLFFNIPESKASFELEYNGINFSVPNIPSDVKYYAVCADNPDVPDPYEGHYISLIVGDSEFTYSDSYGDHALYTTNIKRYLLQYGEFSSSVLWEDYETTSGLYNDKKFYQLGTILYANHDIYYSTKHENAGQLYYDSKLFNYNLNYVEDYNYVQFSSELFDYNNVNDISISFSKDNIDFTEMEIEVADITNEFLYYYNFYQNGTYYIKYSNNITGMYEVFSIEIIDIIKYSINFFLSTEDKTTEPIYILSNQYYYAGDYDASKDFLLNYDIDIAYGLESPYNFSPFLTQCTEVYDEDTNLTYTQYQYKIVANGIYKLRILDLNTGEISYETFNVTNIGIDNKYGEDIYYNNYDEEGNFNPTPVLFLEYVDTSTVRIRTQPFTFNELMYLECYFSVDGENYEKVNNIYKYSVDSGNSSYDYNTGLKQNIQDLYYFYYDVKSDGTYYFKFYNINLDTYTIGSIDVDISQFLIDNVDNIDKYPDRFVIWVEAHFGIIVYPIRFTLNFFGRLLTINYSEPILSIPELHEPFFNYKILDEVNFNFNSLLENINIKIVHDLYLIIVDVIIIYMLIKLAGDIFEEVFKE